VNRTTKGKRKKGGSSYYLQVQRTRPPGSTTVTTIKREGRVGVVLGGALGEKEKTGKVGKQVGKLQPQSYVRRGKGRGIMLC